MILSPWPSDHDDSAALPWWYMERRRWFYNVPCQKKNHLLHGVAPFHKKHKHTTPLLKTTTNAAFSVPELYSKPNIGELSVCFLFSASNLFS